MCKVDYRTDLSKYASINIQIDRNGLNKCSNILYFLVKWDNDLIFCCCQATKDVRSNYVNVIVVITFMCQMCI